MTRPPVFIVGAPRSGTTLLRNMLNRHPALAICGETQFYRFVYSRRQAFGDPAHQRRRERLVDEYLSTERIRRLGMDLTKLRAKLLGEGDSYRAILACILEHYAQSQGKERWGEKTPEHAVFAETLCEWYPGAAILHLVRDPRDVVASLQRMPWASDSVITNARVWVNHNAAARRSRRRPEYLAVRYETLVARPEQELARICAHLGEAYSPLMLAPREESITYSQRSRRSQEQVTAERLDTWREELTQEQAGLVEWACGKSLSALEYERAAPPPSRWSIIRGVAFAMFDAVRRRLSHLPAGLYRVFRPTKLAREEFWVFRRIRERERRTIVGDRQSSKEPSAAN